MRLTDGKIRKVHHAVSLAVRLQGKKGSTKADDLSQIKDQYFLNDEQTLRIYRAAEIARKAKKGEYETYDDVIRIANDEKLEVTPIAPVNKRKGKKPLDKADKEKPKQESKPKQAPAKQEKKKQEKPKAEKKPKQTSKKKEASTVDDNELFSF